MHEDTVTKNDGHGVQSLTVSSTHTRQHFVTAPPDENIVAVFKRVAAFAREHDTRIVAQDVFGPAGCFEEGMTALRKELGPVEWPVAWIEDKGGPAWHPWGTQARAVCGTAVSPLRINGRTAGSLFEDEDAVYCLLTGIHASDRGKPHPQQAEETFRAMESGLSLASMDFSNVVRTWFYIDRILDWYDDFNRVRNEFFQSVDMAEDRLPASTGIGAGNAQGSAVVANVLAIRAKTDRVAVHAVPSPLQCPAPDYHSAFSRAAEVSFPGHRQLYVSGTASIDPEGRTVHAEDLEKQIGQTMTVVGALLESRRMTWRDVARATVYLTDLDRISLFTRYCRHNDVPALPVALAQADICRGDLLFEIEVDAIAAGDPP